MFVSSVLRMFERGFELGPHAQRGDEEVRGRAGHAAAAGAPGEHRVRGLRARLHHAARGGQQQRQQQAQIHVPGGVLGF